jgi:hypothetical protein
MPQDTNCPVAVNHIKKDITKSIRIGYHDRMASKCRYNLQFA